MWIAIAYLYMLNPTVRTNLYMLSYSMRLPIVLRVVMYMFVCVPFIEYMFAC